MKTNPKKPRRATVLLMVVSLLALLFIVVTGFLSIARVDRGMVVQRTEGDLAKAIADDASDRAVSLIKQQFIDDSGKALNGGEPDSYDYEVIPGYGSANFLAALEPVWNGAWNGSWFGWGGSSLTVLEQIVWPAVTSLDAALSLDGPNPLSALPLFRLLRDFNPEQPRPQVADVEWNARTPFGDADGDGVPDAHFLLCASETEAANTTAGRSVQLPRYNPADPNGVNGSFVSFSIPPVGTDAYYRGEKWQRYDEQARYEVAQRIVSHGGMVTLDSPTLYDSSGTAYPAFNRDFTIDLFDAIRDPRDRKMRVQYNPDSYGPDNALFDALHSSAFAIEPALRRRYTIPGRPERVGLDVRKVPAILGELQGEFYERDGIEGFPETFIPFFQVVGTPSGWLSPQSAWGSKPWQRINIAIEEERLGWSTAVALDATDFNLNGAAGAPNEEDLRQQYSERHLITAVNNSDELARKQVAGDPQPSATRPLDLDDTRSRGSTFQGELKYYLGEVSKAFIEVDAAGNPSATPTGRYRYDPVRGKVIVEQLARLYYDMLASHDDWLSLYTTSGTSGKQAVSRRQQALMLAVNTVAFAAPRNTDASDPMAVTGRGFIDVVWYADDVAGTPGNPADDVIYSGYAPQLFFSEVIAFTQKEDDTDDEDLVNAALAVELYNPNDPYYVSYTPPPAVDVFALRLTQYAIAVGDANPNDTVTYPVGGKWQYLSAFTSAPEFFNGRSFMTFVVKDDNESNGRFDATGRPFATLDIVDARTSPPAPGDGGVPGGGSAPRDLDVTLWRLGAGGAWFQVDRTAVEVPKADANRWRSAARDTSPARYFAMVSSDGSTYDAYARWNLVTAHEKTPVGNGAKPDTSTLDNQKWLDRPEGAPARGLPIDPDPPGLVPPFAPTVPLITMNAGPGDFSTRPLYQRLNDMPMFGRDEDPRPRSFPTVGFVLFVPRFSHVRNPAAAAGDADMPVSLVLAEQWDRQSLPSQATPGLYPADFGHMPVFDNSQNVKAGSYLSKVGGGGTSGLPWGQLVFDYFTTLDPQRDVNQDRLPDVDPLRVPGRININTAPWRVLANLPMLGPADGVTVGSDPPDAPYLGQLPIRRLRGFDVYDVAAQFPPVTEVTGPMAPSPSFWDPAVGVLAGIGFDNLDMSRPKAYRLLANEREGATDKISLPWYVGPTGRYRLGAWLAQSAAAYRDGVQYLEDNGASPFRVYADSHLHGGAGEYMLGVEGTKVPFATARYRTPVYGSVRGALITDVTPGAPDRPNQFGFIAVGELLNVKGFDSTPYGLLPPVATASSTTLGFDDTLAHLDPYGDGRCYPGDFVKAVSLLVLLDSQYLTTRSNTFTVYTSVMDRENPEASVRSQVTVDRSNVLPRLTYVPSYYDMTGSVGRVLAVPSTDPAYATYPLAPLLLNTDGDAGAVPETPVRTNNESAEPQIIAREQVGYFNARFDD